MEVMRSSYTGYQFKISKLWKCHKISRENRYKLFPVSQWYGHACKWDKL